MSTLVGRSHLFLSSIERDSVTLPCEQTTLQKKLDQLPAVDIQHAPAKLPSKLHIFAYVDFLAQSLCSMHSDCASKLG